MPSWLIFRPDENGHYPRHSGEMASSQPQELPFGCIAIPWVPEGSCVDASHYARRGNYAVQHQAQDCPNV